MARRSREDDQEEMKISLGRATKTKPRLLRVDFRSCDHSKLTGETLKHFHNNMWMERGTCGLCHRLVQRVVHEDGSLGRWMFMM